MQFLKIRKVFKMSVPLKQRKVKRRKRAGGLLSEEKKMAKILQYYLPSPTPSFIVNF